VTLPDRVSALHVEIESVERERLSLAVSSEFTRVTTVVRLAGGGVEGVGEDVTYDGRLHEPERSPEPPGVAAFGGTLGELSEVLEGVDLYGGPIEMESQRQYRRWAWESAALDLALRQANVGLGDVVERQATPLSFVASTRIDPRSLEPLVSWARLYPTLRFKLDPTGEWDEALVERIDGLVGVDVVDLKGQYKGTVVDNAPSARLYRLAAEAFPEAWIEDPNLEDDPEAAAALDRYRERITWDAPIHSIADVDALPFPPRTLNVKPSRFGSLRALFTFYETCEERGISLYGGGQFELGPGRGHIQHLASIFHADSPNDVAPGEFNAPPREGLPESPLAPSQIRHVLGTHA
jgi:L-alanine-DL-glutamate epimerase-like enolase superfamily enzyme